MKPKLVDVAVVLEKYADALPEPLLVFSETGELLSGTPDDADAYWDAVHELANPKR